MVASRPLEGMDNRFRSSRRRYPPSIGRILGWEAVVLLTTDLVGVSGVLERWGRSSMRKEASPGVGLLLERRVVPCDSAAGKRGPSEGALGGGLAVALAVAKGLGEALGLGAPAKDSGTAGDSEIAMASSNERLKCKRTYQLKRKVCIPGRSIPRGLGTRS